MAAGKGTRMRSQRPKVLHLLAERALLDHVLDTAQGLGARHVVVVTGHESAQVQTAVQATERAQAPVRCVAQSPQLGTGHAVLQAMPAPALFYVLSFGPVFVAVLSVLRLGRGSVIMGLGIWPANKGHLSLQFVDRLRETVDRPLCNRVFCWLTLS